MLLLGMHAVVWVCKHARYDLRLGILQDVSLQMTFLLLLLLLQSRGHQDCLRRNMLTCFQLLRWLRLPQL
jgi:hypothetical protein